MSEIDLAIDILQEAFRGRKDANGESMILHPLKVGLMGCTDEERSVGFLHNILSESSLTAEQLEQQGLSASMVEAIRLLTPQTGMTEMEHAQLVAQSLNPIAIRVMKCDFLCHQSAHPTPGSSQAEALDFLEKTEEENNRVRLYDPSQAITHGLHTAIFAAGCFWGVQHYFDRQKGVTRTLVGYTGGSDPSPSYSSVRTHKSDHVEAILVEYDPQQVSYRQLATLFFEIHDPAQTDGQGPDLGPQYISGIFYANDQQRKEACDLINILRSKGYEVNTRMEPAASFWIAETWHQQYYAHTGGSPYCHIRQKKFD